MIGKDCNGYFCDKFVTNFLTIWAYILTMGRSL